MNTTAYLVAMLVNEDGKIVCKGVDVFSEPNPSVCGLNRVTAVVQRADGRSYEEAKQILLMNLHTFHPWLVPPERGRVRQR